MSAGRDAAARQEGVRAILKALLSCIKARAFYPLRHPTVAAGLRELDAALTAALADAPETVIGVVGRDIVADGQPLVQDSPLFERLREILAAHEIEKVTFRHGVRPEELEALVEALSGAPDALRAAGGLERALMARGVRGVRVGRLATSREDEDAGQSDAEREASATYRQGMQAVEEISEKFRAGQAVSGAEVRQIAGLLIHGLRGRRSAMLAALALRQKSAYTFSHSLNVSLLVLAQVEMLELTERQLEDLTAASLLHDVGKLFVPDEILNKPGRLDEREWEIIRRHPVYGVEALRGLKDVSELVLITAFGHHLRYDGQGYPVRRSPWPASTVTLLTAIADCYDAMRSRRPYDPEWPCEKVYQTMTGLSGSAFHPGLLDRFFRIVGMYPPGTVVRLSSGAVGKVVRNHPAAHDLPEVDLTWTPAEGTLERPRRLDLALERELRGGDAPAVAGSVIGERAPGG